MPPGSIVSYQKHRDTYRRIFERCGLNYLIIQAHSGAMGGSQSEEFMVYTPAGEDQVVELRELQVRSELGKGNVKARCCSGPCAGRRRQTA